MARAMLTSARKNFVSRLATHMAMGDSSTFNARQVGREFLAETGAEANPIKEIAVGFILIAVAMVIALTILPVVTSAVATAQADGNVSATDGTLLGLLPTLLIVGLLAGGVAFLFRGFKNIRA